MKDLTNFYQKLIAFDQVLLSIAQDRGRFAHLSANTASTTLVLLFSSLLILSSPFESLFDIHDRRFLSVVDLFHDVRQHLHEFRSSIHRRFALSVNSAFSQAEKSEKIQPDKKISGSQIIRLHYSGGINPASATVAPGTTVIWINEANSPVENPV